MRFMLVVILVLFVIVTAVDAGGRHKTRTTTCHRYSHGHQASFWRWYHQRRTRTQMSCKKIRISQACNRCCSVDGNWGPWPEFNPCSVSCGNGTQTRSRSCDNPAPAYGGADCHGDGIETRSCNMIGCPVDGKWGTWSEFNPCSVSCGNGTQTRSRSCDNPAPAYGGADCHGDGIETRSCNMIGCPVDGKWGTWSEFNPCSVSCGNGTQTRSRSCDNPAPAYGGADCHGDGIETRSCNMIGCPVDGKWGTWSEFNPCSVSCGNGTQTRSRSCDNPAPAYGGADCHGDGIETRSCNMIGCPVDGKWGTWSEFNPCSVSCGNGTQTRSRSCDNPAPAYGGADCHGDGIKTRSCNMIDCPAGGNWGTWSEFPTCCPVCGVEQTRNRLCDNPEPETGGAECPGDPVETRSCDRNDCLDNVTTSLCANQFLDVFALVDVSADITDEKVEQEKDLLQRLYTELGIDGTSRRFGFIAHGGNSGVNDFNFLSLGAGTITRQKTRISTIVKLGGIPSLYVAVYNMDSDFEFSGTTGHRRIGILITAPERTAANFVESSSVKGINTILYGIFIGDRVSEESVQAIATNAKGATINTGPNQLQETATLLKQVICFCNK